jgi:nucleoside-diphosphate-sugar epimerase
LKKIRRDKAKLSEKVLVTGAGGFIGSHLAGRLASLGNDVLAIDVRERPPRLKSERVNYQRIDIRNKARIKEFLENVKIVYHLASVHLEVRANEEQFEDVNIRAVKDLVVASAEAGVKRFIHTSSVGIYGDVKNPPATENSPVNPVIPYDRTKLAGERVALQTANAIGLDLVVLRPAWVYGPGCPRTEKILRTLEKRRFFYIGKATNLRHPIFIEEMIEAYIKTASGPSSLSGKSYIIAGPKFMPLREMIKTMAEAINVPEPSLTIPKNIGFGLGLSAELIFGIAGKEPPFSRRSLMFFEHNNAFDTSAARNDFGFNPLIDLEEGLRRTLAG